MPDKDYIRSWRTTPEGKNYTSNQRGRTRARNRAIAELISEHPDRWEYLFEKSLRFEEEKDEVPRGSYGRHRKS